MTEFEQAIQTAIRRFQLLALKRDRSDICPQVGANELSAAMQAHSTEKDKKTKEIIATLHKAKNAEFYNARVKLIDQAIDKILREEA